MANNQILCKALEFIENNITKDIDLYDISSAAGFSVPHFYRLFKRLTGDTVGSYINRRRLLLAAGDLLNSDKSVSRIALEYGFESHDVFTRAFKRVFGITPIEYRRRKGSPPLIRQAIIISEEITYEQQMKYSIILTEEFYVVGMECEAKRWDSDGAIGRLWSCFLSSVDKISNVVKPTVMYGICKQDTCENDKFRYMAAIGVTDLIKVPTGMTARLMKAQSYFRACVPASVSVPDAYTAAIAYAKSLGYDLENYDAIELYHEIFQDPEINSFHLLIPIKERQVQAE